MYFLIKKMYFFLGRLKILANFTYHYLTMTVKRVLLFSKQEVKNELIKPILKY